MPKPVTHITLDMCITQTKRIIKVMEDHYPQMVKDEKITPYDRDHRMNVQRKLLSLLEQAKENKINNTGPTFCQLIKNLPHE